MHGNMGDPIHRYILEKSKSDWKKRERETETETETETERQTERQRERKRLENSAIHMKMIYCVKVHVALIKNNFFLIGIHSMQG